MDNPFKSPIEYFFFEWMVLTKDMTDEKFNSLTVDEKQDLIEEFSEAFNTATVVEVK